MYRSVVQFLGNSSVVENRGPGKLFQVLKDGQIFTAFLIRNNDCYSAYLNVCAHVGLRLNGDKNIFFNHAKTHLYCRSHGAIFEPDSGVCIDGPCKGLSLIPLEIEEIDDELFLVDEGYTIYA